MAPENHDPRLDVSAVRARFDKPEKYGSTDVWHRFTAMEIRRELQSSWRKLRTQAGDVVLNAGAGNSDLGVCSTSAINLDISELGVASLPNPIVASVEKIPLPSESVDTIVCVGSVINYCDAAAAIRAVPTAHAVPSARSAVTLLDPSALTSPRTTMASAS